MVKDGIVVGKGWCFPGGTIDKWYCLAGTLFMAGYNGK